MFNSIEANQVNVIVYAVLIISLSCSTYPIPPLSHYPDQSYAPTKAAPQCKTEEEIFSTAYQENLWGGRNTRSGQGSDLQYTKAIRSELPKAIEELEITTILDIGCGDCWWLSHTTLPNLHYIGIDIVPDLIQDNKEKFGSRGWEFIQKNCITDQLPQMPHKGSAILCRSVIPLLYFNDALKLIARCKETGAEFFICTTYTDHMKNSNISERWRTFIWARPVNMQLPPFNFTEPIMIISEAINDPFLYDKSLGVWRMDDIVCTQ